MRDSELDRTAKLVALIVATYMDSTGVAFPSKETIARGAGLGAGRRAVDAAIDRLEAAGLLEVRRTSGRRPNVYRASGCAVQDAQQRTEMRCSESAEQRTAVRGSDGQQRTNRHSTAHPAAHESVESIFRETKGAAPSARRDLSHLDEGAIR